MSLRPLLTFIFVSFAFVSFAQTEKGFDYLNDKKWEKAWSAFSNDTSDQTAAAAAYFGLAKICARFADRSLDTAEMALDYFNTSQYLYTHGSDDAVKFGKKFKITNLTYRDFPARLAQTAWKGVEKSNSLDAKIRFRQIFPDAYDEYAQSLESAAWNAIKQSRSFEDLEKLRTGFPDFFDRNQTPEVQNIRREIVRNTYEKTTDYQTLNLLAQYHLDYLYNDDITMDPDWDRKLWSAFRKTVGVENLGQFLMDHPDHWLNFDCRAKECATALSDKSLKSLVNFIEKYPESYLGYSTVCWHIYNKLSVDKSTVRTLNASEKRRFDEIMETCKTDVLWSNAKQDLPDSTGLLALIQRGAPSWRSYFLMKGAVLAYVQAKQYDAASWIISACKPLFPNLDDDCQYFYFTRSQWFSAMEDILKTSDEPINPRSIVELNTTGNEILPFVSPDRRYLYFTGEGRPDGLQREDPYEVPFSDSTFGKPQLIPNLAGDRNESLLAVTGNGEEALVFIDGVIHLSKMTPKGWTKPKPIPAIQKNFAWIGKASMNLDGSVMVFEAMRTKAIAGRSPDMDLYVAMRDSNGNWQRPFALPPNINTRFRERSPYLQTDGESLYFSSNGHLGLGGMDIFKTKRLDSSWTRWEDPINLGKEINTTADDLGYNFSVMSDGKTVFFSQKDPTGANKWELMMAGLPKRARSKAIRVIQIPVKATSDFQLEVKNRNGVVLQTVPVYAGSTKATIAVAEEEELVSAAPKGDDIIAAPVEIDMTQPLNTAAPVTDTMKVNTIKELVDRSEIFEIPAVNFDRSKSVLRPDALLALSKFYRAIEGKKLLLQITGHTDNVGTFEANQKLSVDRATNVRNYLVDKGYPTKLISVIGKGWSEPKVDNTTEETKSINRRVEFQFLK